MVVESEDVRRLFGIGWPVAVLTNDKLLSVMLAMKNPTKIP